MKSGFVRKRCPKCGGNIFIDREYSLEGSFVAWFEQESCLQCGYTCYPKADIAPMEGLQVTKATKKLITV